MVIFIRGLVSIATSLDEPGCKPYLVNGGLKAINQLYDKRRAKMTSELPSGKRTSRAIERLTRKLNNKIDNVLHHARKWIAERCNRNNICKVELGQDKGWKQEVNLGTTNNQTFVGIPHFKFIEMLRYKLCAFGIELITTDEAYTSKCSFY